MVCGSVLKAGTVLEETESLELDAGEKAARSLLAAVAEQDIEELPDGTVTLKDGAGMVNLKRIFKQITGGTVPQNEAKAVMAV